MINQFSKPVIVIASLIWAGFTIFIVMHVEKNAGHYGTKISNFAAKMRDKFNSSIVEEELEAETESSQYRINPALVNIIIQAQDDNIGGLITAVNSLVSNSRPQLHFYFVLPPDTDTILHLHEWMKVPELSNLKYSIATIPAHLTKYSYAAKFAFIDLFPSLHGKVIFLEPDVIIQGNIMELFQTKMLPESLGAFSDDCHASSRAISSRAEYRYGSRLNLEHPSISKLNPLTCTFSTGVFVADVDLWRKEGVADKIESLLQEKESIIGVKGGTDEVEAAMLAILYKRTSQLDPLWHVRHLGITRGSRYSPSFISTAKLLHWNGHFKPWKSTRNGAYEQKLWDKYFIRDPLGRFKPIRKMNSEI